MTQDKNTNLFLAAAVSFLIIFGWQYLVEKPMQEKNIIPQSKIGIEIKESEPIKREDSIHGVKRVQINSPCLHGSINLEGFRIDDLTLAKYKQELNSGSPEVELFSPSNTMNAYFAELGWYDFNHKLDVPDSKTIWHSDKPELKINDKVTLSHINKDGVKFIIEISLDENYMFTVTQGLENNSGEDIEFNLYGLINRIDNIKEDRMTSVVHQGFIGAVNNKLEEYNYSKIKSNKTQHFEDADVSWLGISDKYWLSAFIPDKKLKYAANFIYSDKGAAGKYQADFTSQKQKVSPGETYAVKHHLFAGAKNVKLLDEYERVYDIKLFDRAIDFGWFYILTKPMFNALNFFYKIVGNFGISIIIVTLITKLLMFSLANRSFRSMKKLKELQPQVERLKKTYENDKQKFNLEILNLYKREKANPMGGCLPIILQVPVFFSLYKVLSVTIEMRHAPFFGWIKDLSAPDPTSLFNLFGLLPYDVPSFLNIGIWPIIMGITMYLQQKMSPPATDPVQAQVMKMMPLMFLVLFASFPAGLIIYWSFNNILSLAQQYVINKQDK